MCLCKHSISKVTQNSGPPCRNGDLRTSAVRDGEIELEIALHALLSGEFGHNHGIGSGFALELKGTILDHIQTRVIETDFNGSHFECEPGVHLVGIHHRDGLLPRLIIIHKNTLKDWIPIKFRRNIIDIVNLG